jgi:predicted Rossmann-fold nucleotide-binding protein
MPGGNGSLDEFFEMLTWNTLNIHNKKIIILNSNGFYEHLIAHLHRMDQEQFLYEDPMHRIKIVDSPEMIFSSDFF